MCILFCSYLQALEWILIYSTVPITFHVITNEDSVPYVTKVLDKLNETSESDFQKQILTLSEIISRSNNEICPKLGVRSEFCEVVMGNMTPLLFPWLFPKLDLITNFHLMDQFVVSPTPRRTFSRMEIASS